MTVIGEAFVAVRPRTDGFERDITGRIGGIARKAAGLFAGAFAVTKGIDFLGGAIGEAREAAKVSRDTAAAIRSTGAAANLTADDIGDLSERIGETIGKDDELIQSSANVLLTFTKVRDEVGRGNDVFSQSVEIAQDMAARLGGDASGAALQLGKALNDPIKGIAALSRAGVSFTQQQKDTIKSLVEQGRTLDAQKIILGELRTEFEGSAAAQSDAGDRLRVVYDNLRERLGTRLLPVMETAARIAGVVVPKAFDLLDRGIDAITPTVEKVAEGVKAFFTTLRTGFTEGEGTGIERFALTIREDVLPVVRQLLEFIRRNWRAVLIGAAAAFIALTSPVTAVVATLVLLYTRFQVVRDVVATVATFLVEQFRNVRDWAQVVWPQVQEAVEHVINAITAAWRLFGDDILRVAQAIWDQIRLVIETAVNTIRSVIELVLALINGDWGKAWNALKDLVGGILKLLIGTIRNLLGELRGIFGAAFDAARAVVRAALDAIIGFVRDHWPLILGLLTGPIGLAVFFIATHIDSIVDFFRKLPGRILDALGDLAGWLVKKGEDLILGFVRGYFSFYGTIFDFWFGLPGRIVDFIGDVGSLLFSIGVDLIQGLIDGVLSMVDKVRDVIGDVVGGLAGVAGSILGVSSPSKVFAEIGRQVGAGFIAGLDAMGRPVREALDAMLNPAGLDLSSPSLALASGGSAGAPSGSAMTLTIRVVGPDGAVTEVTGTPEQLSAREIRVRGRAS